MSKNKDLISIVIPCFNSGKTIFRAINSSRSQTWQNIEIIVINDGSNDDHTINKLDSLPDDVKIIHQSNKGLPAARNKGFSEAKGKFVLPLDADDWIESNTLEIMHKELTYNSKSSYVFSDIFLEGKFNQTIKKDFNYFEQLFFNKIPYCILIPKQIWEKVGGYDESFFNGYEDWEFNIRLGKFGYFGKRISRPLFHYYIDESGMLLSKSSKLHSKIWFDIVRKNSNSYSLKNLFSTWKMWRNKKSEYPIFIYFIWFFLLTLIPKNISSIIFLNLRNIKWLFTRK